MGVVVVVDVLFGNDGRHSERGWQKEQRAAPRREAAVRQSLQVGLASDNDDGEQGPLGSVDS